MSLLDSTFFSETYGAEYELSLEAWGEGILKESDLLDMQKLDAVFGKFKKRYRRYPKDISLILKDPYEVGYDFGYTGIETAFLEKLQTLKELVLPPSVTDIEMTPSLREILKANGTLIRGSFDSFAERFAAGNRLDFRPSDFIFAEYFFEPAQESTRLTLVFKRDGSVLIREDCSMPGTSVSNTLGGTFTHPLPNDFYLTQTAGQIAGGLNARLCGAVTEDGRLRAFLEKAKTHGYYTGKK